MRNRQEVLLAAPPGSSAATSECGPRPPSRGMAATNLNSFFVSIGVLTRAAEWGVPLALARPLEEGSTRCLEGELAYFLLPVSDCAFAGRSRLVEVKSTLAAEITRT